MTVKAKLGVGVSGGVLAIAWLLLLAVSGAARAADPAPAAAAPPPPAVTVAKPVFKNITEWDDYTGRFIAKERVDVRARVSGYLESVHFKEGQMVAPSPRPSARPARGQKRAPAVPRRRGG